MVSQLALGRSRGRGHDHVAERFVGTDAAKATRAPRAQVVLNAAFDRHAEHQPWLPHRTRHHAHVVELDMCGLGPITAAHRHHEAHQFATALEAGPRECAGHHMRQKRVARDNDVRARHEHRPDRLSPTKEEPFERREVVTLQNRETRQWCHRRREGCATHRRAPHEAFVAPHPCIREARKADRSRRRARCALADARATSCSHRGSAARGRARTRGRLASWSAAGLSARPTQTRRELHQVVCMSSGQYRRPDVGSFAHLKPAWASRRRDASRRL
jgi:hypothetical protein